MIKNIIDLTEKEKQMLKTSPVAVIEMLDGLRFKVSFDNTGYVIKTAKGKVIDEVDYLVNTFYREIVDYMRNVITRNIVDKIYRVLGECDVTFIYIPEKRYNVITYNNYTKKRVVLCSLYTQDKERNDILWLFTLLKEHVSPEPVIRDYDNGLPVEYFDDLTVYDLIGNTFSGNDIDDIEGVILKVGNKNVCKITINPTVVNIDMTTKKLYRDTIMEDFAKVMSVSDVEGVFTDEDNYVDCICKLFYEYVNITDISKKLYIEPEDLLPPSMGDVGDIDLNLLPPTAKLICCNPVYMNVLRLLLVTFKTDDVHKFDSFSPPVRETLLKIYNKINNV